MSTGLFYAKYNFLLFQIAQNAIPVQNFTSVLYLELKIIAMGKTKFGWRMSTGAERARCQTRDLGHDCRST